VLCGWCACAAAGRAESKLEKEMEMDYEGDLEQEVQGEGRVEFRNGHWWRVDYWTSLRRTLKATQVC
jgi:hypothetical protein